MFKKFQKDAKAYVRDHPQGQNQQTIIDEQERQIKELKNKLAEVEEAVPALFASVGDVFTHATDDRGDAGDVFEYEGRTSEGWLIFHHIEGGGFHGYHGLNGGVRDAIGAFPVSIYGVKLPNGERDVDRFKLPPKMCYMFRREIEVEDTP